MKTNNISFAIAMAFVGLFFCLSAHGERKALEAISNMCLNGQTEGRYSVALSGKEVAPLYIVCLDQNEIALTWKMNKEGNEAITLMHNALDGDQMTFSSFGLDEDDGKSIMPNAMPGIRLQVSYSALAHGVLEGHYKTLRTRIPKSFRATREAEFPNFLMAGNHQRDYLKSIGTFLLEAGRLGPVAAHFPVYMDLDVISGVQRVAMTDSDDLSVALFDGMSAVGAGNVLYVNSGVYGREGVLMPLHHIRGHLTAAGDFEFYYFNTLSGMNGPLHAKPLKL